MLRLSTLTTLSALALLVSAPSLAAAQPGWRTLELGSGRRAVRYLPASVRACDPLPVLVFLHGAGGTPEAYQSHVTPDAEALGLVLVMPQASGAGWSGADVPTIQDALAAAGAELNLDSTRTYFGGHSAGGAFAYLLTYEGATGIAAVFSMSAPFYAISSLSDPAHRAPIRMYYGAEDPNHTGGGSGALEAQWARLGVPHQTDLQAGYGHSTWPASSIRAGYDFLLTHRYPSAAPPSTCPGEDAGVALDGGARSDAGSATDASVVAPDAAPARDAGPTRDDGGGRATFSGGCACRAGGPRGGLSSGLLLGCLLGLLGTARHRRARRGAPRRP